MRKTIVGSALLLLALIFITPDFSSAAKTTYNVKKGDTLYTIAKKHNVSVKALRKNNNLRTSKLALGQNIVIKEDNDKPAKRRSAKKDKKDTNLYEVDNINTAGEIATTITEEEDRDFIEYKAKKGDTLDKVAALFNIDKEELISYNGLKNRKSRRLSAGRVLLIPKVIEEDDSAEEEIVSLTNKPLRPWKNNEEKYMLVKVAKSFMGAPYKYGGNTVKGLDCSGYVRKIYEIFDIQLPRSARDQFRIGCQINDSDLAVGDLVFFKTKRYVKYPTHVGIYIGDGNFIHSSSGHGRIGVKIDSLSSDYYARVYIGAKRIKGTPHDESPEAGTTFEKTADNS